jgi:hypothetical protein
MTSSPGPLCLSLQDQQKNPIRNWTRDVLVCTNGNSIVKQANHKQQVLANQNGNGSVVNGQITKALRYSKLAKNPGLILCNN